MHGKATMIGKRNCNKVKGSKTRNGPNIQKGMQINDRRVMASRHERIDLSLMRPRTVLSY